MNVAHIHDIAAFICPSGINHHIAGLKRLGGPSIEDPAGVVAKVLDQIFHAAMLGNCACITVDRRVVRVGI